MKSNKKFMKNDVAFTGLEAAIVLIAFVVVAAVFSYVMLGAGFFTSQKSKEVVHTGVDQATSSIQLSGDVSAVSNGAGTIKWLYVTLELTAGNNPIDLTKVTVSYKDDTKYFPGVWEGSNNWDYSQKVWVASNQAGGDNMLEQSEKIRLSIDLDTGAHDPAPGANTEISLEVKPQSGAILPITIHTPPVISNNVMILV
jgi:flagellin FlaB